MPLDTQTFAISRWWAHTGLSLIQSNGSIFSSSSLRQARREFIAGRNQINAIKNWMLAAQLIQKNGNAFELTREGQTIVKNDKELKKSSTWWAFHLLVCFGEDTFPYDAFFSSMDSNLKHFISLTNIKEFLFEVGGDRAESSIETYFEGVQKMFREDGVLQGLGLIETKKSSDGENYFKLANPFVSDATVLFALSLAKNKFFRNRPTIDFGELIKINLDRYLALSQDDLKQQLIRISHSPIGQGAITFNDVANISSIGFDSLFNEHKMLIVLLQEGADSWM